MNKLSKLTALLLAFVLALGVPMQVMAEGEEIETKTKYYEVADQILQAMIMSYQTYGEYKSMAELIAEEDFVAFYEGLSEEDQVAMANYVIQKFWASCISYTNVGPFLPPIDVNNGTEVATLSLTERAATEDEKEEDDGLFLKKDAKDNGDGTYTITLEAYVTGSVTIEQVDVFNPADIVLVLDTSGSMTSDFSGQSRAQALINAVNGFIDTVATKYDAANGVDHRIAIVDYDSYDNEDNQGLGVGVATKAPLTAVEGDGITTLRNAIPTYDADDGGDFAGGTDPALGLKRANELLAAPYKGSSNKPRSKVVVLFTDGKPSYTSFEPEWTVNAITEAKALKDAEYTVYTVAIIPDASPTNSVDWTINSNNTDAVIADAFLNAVSSNYPDATATYQERTFVACTHERKYDRWGREYCPEGCTQQWVNNRYQWGYYEPAHVNITPKEGGNNGYYLTAGTPKDLEKIFQSIASNIETGSTTSTLTETTVVKDVLSPYFDLPYTLNEDGTKNYTNAKITITEYDHTGDTTDGTPTWTKLDTTTATYEIVGENTLHVTNFDFQENAVVTVTNNNVPDYQGKKLVITFVVEPTDGFLGGNNVVTNDPSSGIYQPSEDGTTLEPVKPFPEPVVDVDVPDLEIIGADQHIYLSNLADLDALLHSFQVQYWIKEGDSKYGIYTVDTILNHYTTLTFTLKDEQGNAVATYTIQAGKQTGTWTYNTKDYPSLQLPFEEDTTFYVSYEAISSNDSSNKSVGTLKATIYVYKPEVTFKDTQHDYLADLTAEQVTNYFDDENYVVTERKWYNESLRQYSTALQYMNGPEPDLIFTYAPVSATENNVIITPNEDGSGVISAVQCVPVNVKNVVAKSTYKDYSMDENNGPVETIVATNELDVSKVVKSYRQEISCDCAYDTPENKITDVLSDTVYEFVVHIKNAFSELKIIKKGLSVGESAIFTVTGYVPNGTAVGEQKTWTVVLTKASANAELSVTITGLLVGSTAAVEEAGNWSWRYQTPQYEPDTKSVEILPKTQPTATITITNTNKNNQWLDDEVAVQNNFSVNGPGTVID